MKPAAFGKRGFEGKRSNTPAFGRGGSPSASKAKPASEAKSKFSSEDPAKKAESAEKAPPPPPSKPPGNAANADIDRISEIVEKKLLKILPPGLSAGRENDEISSEITNLIKQVCEDEKIEFQEGEILDLQTYVLNEYLLKLGSEEGKDDASGGKEEVTKDDIVQARDTIQPLLMEHIDASAAAEMPRAELAEQVGDVVGELLVQEKINLNLKEQRQLVTILLDDMLGLGPLEPLLADDDINDIMVNGCYQVYIERKGKLELTDVKFRSEQHLMNIAQRIVSAVGRRVDESSPICDARLLDGSRVNVIIPPLAIDGASISIRKFAKQSITLDDMINNNNLSQAMGTVLKIAAACRLNILISGGTGSGKTTMLNALSKMIDPGERVVTIEDAAELQLQQPHVVRLETRPANLEGSGEVTMRDLVKNSLRMRPDRVILGEIRGAEAVDMLQAMNTGHDGSLGTLHANRPREALTRMENMVNMAGMNLPPKAIRTQISDALHMIVQVSRMRDGIRRTAYITEVVGMEGDVVTTQDLFTYKFTGEDEAGKLQGDYLCTGVRPAFFDKAEYYGFGQALMRAMG